MESFQTREKQIENSKLLILRVLVTKNFISEGYVISYESYVIYARIKIWHGGTYADLLFVRLTFSKSTMIATSILRTRLWWSLTVVILSIENASLLYVSRAFHRSFQMYPEFVPRWQILCHICAVSNNLMSHIWFVCSNESGLISKSTMICNIYSENTAVMIVNSSHHHHHQFNAPFSSKINQGYGRLHSQRMYP